MVVVRIPTPLRKLADGRAQIEVGGENVREAFDSLDASCEGIKGKVFDDAGDVRRFINVFFEKEPPYEVAAYEMDDEALDQGRSLWRRRLEVYKTCVEKDEWPGYSDAVQVVNLPDWAIKEV